MSVAYGPHGLYGMLVPQANTTVEPETARLLPDGHAFIAARMVSAAPHMLQRLADYHAGLARWIGQFAGAPIAACGFACTGASYPFDPESEARWLEAAEAESGIPVLAAAPAIAAALHCLGARRIALVSPYDAALTCSSEAYWMRHGFTVAQIEEVAPQPAAFHPIYALGEHAATGALTRIDRARCEAIVILGTGLPSLHALHAEGPAAPVPVLSSMLCLVWNLVTRNDDAATARETLRAWPISRPVSSTLP